MSIEDIKFIKKQIRSLSIEIRASMEVTLKCVNMIIDIVKAKDSFNLNQRNIAERKVYKLNIKMEILEKKIEKMIKRRERIQLLLKIMKETSV